jgi:AcrR family transcriptional regulator
MYYMQKRASIRGHARERLLDTGAELFYAHGIHSVSVDRVADETGVTKRTVYQHFSSKDDLVAEALARKGQSWRTWFDAELGRRGESATPQLLAMFDVIADEVAEGHYRGCRFINAAAELSDPSHPARDVARAHKAAVLELIVRRVEELDVADPASLARQLKLLLEGAIATALVEPAVQPARDARDAAESLISQMTSGKPRAQRKGK